MVEAAVPVPNGTAAVDMEAQQPVTEVRVDSLVVMQILQHVQDAVGSAGLAGQLLGMDVAGTLQVTNSFAFPAVTAEAEEGNARARQQYAQEMISKLGQVGADQNVVGWYQNVYLGSYVDKALLDAQVGYQQGGANDCNIVLVNDLAQSLPGVLKLRAFRLTSEYLAANKEGSFTSAALAKHGLNHQKIFEELPVKIHNSQLASLLVHDILEPRSTVDQLQMLRPDFEQKDLVVPNVDLFELSVDSYVEKSLEEMLETVDEHHYDQSNYQYYGRQLAREQAKIQAWIARRKQENAAREQAKLAPLPEDEWKRLFRLPTEPSRLDHMLLSAQIEQYCNQLDGYASTTIGKMYAIRDGIAPSLDQQ